MLGLFVVTMGFGGNNGPTEVVSLWMCNALSDKNQSYFISVFCVEILFQPNAFWISEALLGIQLK